MQVRTLPAIITAPGSTASIREESIRSPFAATVARVFVTDGDRVRAGTAVATVVARDSVAELQGAQEMLRRASTPEQRSDAERAVALAQRNMVEQNLRTAVDGIVKSHTAVAGDRVAEGDPILTIASLAEVAFVANVAQADMTWVRPGNTATIRFTGGKATPGVVQTILPGNTNDLTTPVRIQFRAHPSSIGIGLVGSAEIIVAEHRDVPTVPADAILRDDVTGTTKIALVNGGKLHWQPVQTGLSYQGAIELTNPTLAAGTQVITSGQVGLAEGVPVTISATP
ncbi:MAG TPA: HlyD family efflux transporter periplasmic adaptor subunit [Thermoanaerobaculia bacterium]|nr:HlyD family efflux transporter periplasmic adaptor subunit [Thermoanaerobaculia bacterium]